MRYTNTVLAFINGVKNIELDVLNHYLNIETGSKNKINKVGDLAEIYIKDLYCNSIYVNNLADKREEYKKYFSYLGGKNSPPDAIISGGEAIEIKKQENMSFGDISLNSSHPSDFLYNESSLINRECRECESSWDKKHMVYSILNFDAKAKELKSVWFIYGNCFAAKKETYQKIKEAIKEAIANLSNLSLSETNELGKVLNIDDMGITSLRVRGMWNISHPEKIFKTYLKDLDLNKKTVYKLLMLEEDFKNLDTFTLKEVDIAIKENLITKKDIDIPNPNNKEKTLKAILLHN